MSKKIIVVLSLAVAFGLSGSVPAYGSGNDADIDQVAGTYNDLLLDQQGSGNKVAIDQVADTYNEAYIYQKGTGNDIQINQHADTSYNYAHVLQEGNDNIAHLITKYGGGNGSEPVLVCPADAVLWVDFSALHGFSTIYDGAYVTQYQDGDDNKAYTTISGVDNQTAQWQEGDGNYADLQITGNNNHAKQVQLDGGNTANMTIIGSDNLVGQYQKDGGHHSSKITVTGDGKCVYVYGSGNWP